MQLPTLSVYYENLLFDNHRQLYTVHCGFVLLSVCAAFHFFDVIACSAVDGDDDEQTTMMMLLSIYAPPPDNVIGAAAKRFLRKISSFYLQKYIRNVSDQACFFVVSMADTA